MDAAEAAPAPIEAGESMVSVTISGQIELPLEWNNRFDRTWPSRHPVNLVNADKELTYHAAKLKAQ